ncbi:hypothetical protein SSCG_02158 [Streptomyces clavuligerus]|nr:hypothetical protein SSCG_02158 [Streptomyces clavuligerus]
MDQLSGRHRPLTPRWTGPRPTAASGSAAPAGETVRGVLRYCLQRVPGSAVLEIGSTVHPGSGAKTPPASRRLYGSMFGTASCCRNCPAMGALCDPVAAAGTW